MMTMKPPRLRTLLAWAAAAASFTGCLAVAGTVAVAPYASGGVPTLQGDTWPTDPTSRRLEALERRVAEAEAAAAAQQGEILALEAALLNARQLLQAREFGTPTNRPPLSTVPMAARGLDTPALVASSDVEAATPLASPESGWQSPIEAARSGDGRGDNARGDGQRLSVCIAIPCIPRHLDGLRKASARR